MRISLKYKLFSLILLTILVSLSISSFIYYKTLYDDYYHESYISTKKDLISVQDKLKRYTDKLILISNTIITDKSIKTGLNLISNYEDKDNYSSTLFDEEKKRLLEDLNKKILIIDDLSFGLFDKNGDMILIHRTLSNQKHNGIITYKNGTAELLNIKSGKTSKTPKCVKPTTININKMNTVAAEREFGLKYTQAIYLEHKLVGYLRIKKTFTQNNINSLTNNLKNKFSFLTKNLLIGDIVDIDKDLIIKRSTPFPKADHKIDIIADINYFLHSHYINTSRGNKLHFISFYNKDKLHSKIDAMNKQLLIAILISVVISMFLASIFLRYSILNPINKLMSNINNIKNGDYDNLQTVKRYDELGKIADSFNDMVKLIKKREEQLLKSKESLKEAQYVAKLGSWEFDYKNKTIHCSDELCHILKIEKENTPKTIITLREHIYKKDKGKFEKVFKNSIKENIEFELEHRIVKNDDSIGYVQSKAIHRYNKDGKLIKTVGTMLDISKIKNLEKSNREKEQMLFQQSKMAAMGEMIGNIAHQWRQPIAIISMWANNIIADLDMGEVENESLRKYATKINEQTHHLSQTIDDFRNFFTPNKEKTTFTLKSSIDKTMGLLLASFKTHNIEVIEDIEEIEITALENELTQSLLNIIKNAKDILITFDRDTKKLIFINIYKKENSVYIEIKDNGGGVPTNIIDKVFEPYFTTKHKSLGTGIGLYMSESIITKHLHGKISVENIEYKYENIKYNGAKFTIELPISF